MMWRAAGPLGALFLLACSGPQSFPGDEVMGTFRFQAELASTDCEGFEVPQGFTFEGTYSRVRNQSEGWFTLGGVSGEASFDGQTMRSERLASRRFDHCTCANVSLTERLWVALLSKSQDEEIERRDGRAGCPPAALDGGVPVENVDAGIQRPDSTSRGFDAVRACGELTNELVPDSPDAGCACAQCRMVYQVRGERR